MFETDYELFLGKKFLIGHQKDTQHVYSALELGTDQTFVHFFEILENFLKNGLIDIGEYKYGWIPDQALSDIHEKYKNYSLFGQKPLENAPQELKTSLTNELNHWDETRDNPQKNINAGHIALGERPITDYCFICEKRVFIFADSETLSADHFYNGLNLKIRMPKPDELRQALDKKIKEFINDTWPLNTGIQNKIGYGSLKKELITRLSVLYERYKNKTLIHKFNLDEYGYGKKAEKDNELWSLLGIEKEGLVNIDELALVNGKNPTEVFAKLQLTTKFFELTKNSNALIVDQQTSFDSKNSIITCNAAPGKSYYVRKNKPSFYLCKKMFKIKPGIGISWDALDEKNLTEQKPVFDAADHINKKIREIFGVNKDLFTFQNHTLTRNF